MRRRFINNLNNSFDISNYMTIEAMEDNVEIIMPREVEYGIDGEGWKKYKGSIIINLGQTASFKCILPPMLNIRFGHIVINGKCKLCGNCLSLIFGDDIQYDLTGYTNCFIELFLNNKGVLSVEPHFLPATTLEDLCYYDMFSGCTSLTTAPELPATTLAFACYEYMFYKCTSLTTAPALPATKLETNCYDGMFNGCTKLNYIKMLATDISAKYCLDGWVSGVASTGTFVKNPEATWDALGTSGVPSGWTVVNDGEESGGNLITFTLNGIEYQAEEGMTWEEFCNSEYNINSFHVIEEGGNSQIWCDGGSHVSASSYVYDVVSKDDLIINNHIYYSVSGEPI